MLEDFEPVLAVPNGKAWGAWSPDRLIAVLVLAKLLQTHSYREFHTTSHLTWKKRCNTL